MQETDVAIGDRHGYRWLSIRGRVPLLRSLVGAVPEIVVGNLVAITACDSGPVCPNEEEKKQGWHRDGRILWTNRISNPDALPTGGYDEWYVFAEPALLAEAEVFVNYTGFSLEEPGFRSDLLDENPTWDRRLADPDNDPHNELRERFWQHIVACGSISYVAEGDCLNFATCDEGPFAKVLDWTRRRLRQSRGPA
jgi:hypothetical protein